MAQVVESSAKESSEKPGTVPSKIEDLIKKTGLKNEDEETLEIESMTVLSESRRARYAPLCKEHADLSSGTACAVLCKGTPVSEKIVHVDESGTKMTDIILECQISYEEFAPSGLVEYQFDADGPFYLSQMCQSSLEYYKTKKYANWQEMIKKPDCEAAFTRLLRMGLLNRMFDPVALPSPENEKAQWMVKDERGRDVQVPRVVNALRIWNPSKQAYDAISPILAGAPSDSEKDKAWDEMLKGFRQQYGEAYIDGLLRGEDVSGLKKKSAMDVDEEAEKTPPPS